MEVDMRLRINHKLDEGDVSGNYNDFKIGYCLHLPVVQFLGLEASMVLYALQEYWRQLHTPGSVTDRLSEDGWIRAPHTEIQSFCAFTINYRALCRAINVLINTGLIVQGRPAIAGNFDRANWYKILFNDCSEEDLATAYEKITK
jgi:hypothetical protein